MAALAEHQGGPLLLPAGTCRITAPIKSRGDSEAITGTGIFTTTLLQADPASRSW